MLVKRIKIALCVIALWACAGMPQAQADVISVTANPGARTASLAHTSGFSVTWVVATSASREAVVLTSAAGEFRLDGTPVATTRAISRRFSNGMLGTYQIVESVSVPRHLAIQAHRTGQTLEYVRVFADGGALDASGEVVITIAGSQAGEGGVAALNLTFDDGTDYRAVALGASLRAQAQITTTGAGVLRGVWEVADAMGGGGAPLYRTIQNVTRPITVASAMTVISPLLPTSNITRVRVRFRVITPALSADTPSLDYFVTDTAAAPRDAPFTPKVSASAGGGMRRHK